MHSLKAPCFYDCSWELPSRLSLAQGKRVAVLSTVHDSTCVSWSGAKAVLKLPTQLDPAGHLHTCTTMGGSSGHSTHSNNLITQLTSQDSCTHSNNLIMPLALEDTCKTIKII